MNAISPVTKGRLRLAAAVIAVSLSGAAPNPTLAQTPDIAGAAASQALQALAPCLLPHPDTASYVAAFEAQGWTRVIEGALFERAALATGEINLAIRVMPGAFESVELASKFLSIARENALRFADVDGIALMVRGDLNLQIGTDVHRDRLKASCVLAAPRLDSVEAGTAETPREIGRRTLAMSTAGIGIPPLPGIRHADANLIRLFLPREVLADSPGSQGIALVVSFDSGVTGTSLSPGSTPRPAAGDGEADTETAAATVAGADTKPPAPTPTGPVSEVAVPAPAAGTEALSAQEIARLVTVQCSLPGFSLAQRIDAFKAWHEAAPAEIARFADIYADAIQGMAIVEHGDDPEKAAEAASRIRQTLLKRLTVPLDDIGQYPTRLLVTDTDPALALAIGEDGAGGRTHFLTCSFLIDAPSRERAGGLAGLFPLSMPTRAQVAEILRVSDSVLTDDTRLIYQRRLIVLGSTAAPRAAMLFASMQPIPR